MPDYFQAVIDGKKPFEVRKNDRDFKSGDHCILEEYKGKVYLPAIDYKADSYTGRDCLIKIKDVFDLTAAGLAGYVAFTFDIKNMRLKTK